MDGKIDLFEGFRSDMRKGSWNPAALKNGHF